MSVRYIYNTSGEYSAFISQNNLFNIHCEWIGFIKNGNEVYNNDGIYIGLVTDDDRIVRNKHFDNPYPKLIPTRPTRPVRPKKPIRRLRMPRLPYPYEDIFEIFSNDVEFLDPNHDLKDFSYLKGANIISSNGKFLGVIDFKRHSGESIANRYGTYGSAYSSDSIFNKYGLFGSKYSNKSPFNKYTTTPPKIVKNEKFIGNLTVNRNIMNRIDTNEFIIWFEKNR